MKVGGYPVVFSTPLRGAQMTQTVCQAGAHRSTPTGVAVEPVSRIEQHCRVRPASGHTFDIRV